jgi:hypothetical protein
MPSRWLIISERSDSSWDTLERTNFQSEALIEGLDRTGVVYPIISGCYMVGFPAGEAITAESSGLSISRDSRGLGGSVKLRSFTNTNSSGIYFKAKSSSVNSLFQES